MKVQLMGVVLEWTQQRRLKNELSEFCLFETYVDKGLNARGIMPLRHFLFLVESSFCNLTPRAKRPCCHDIFLPDASAGMLVGRVVETEV